MVQPVARSAWLRQDDAGQSGAAGSFVRFVPLRVGRALSRARSSSSKTNLCVRTRELTWGYLLGTFVCRCWIWVEKNWSQAPNQAAVELEGQATFFHGLRLSGMTCFAADGQFDVFRWVKHVQGFALRRVCPFWRCSSGCAWRVPHTSRAWTPPKRCYSFPVKCNRVIVPPAEIFSSDRPPESPALRLPAVF